MNDIKCRANVRISNNLSRSRLYIYRTKRIVAFVEKQETVYHENEREYEWIEMTFHFACMQNNRSCRFQLLLPL